MIKRIESFCFKMHLIVAKVVRDTKNAKKQKENIPADTFNDFYEEELNWWDKDLKEGEK